VATTTSEDTEITLGVGKMLALFFGLVALCAVFFGLGFSFGRNSVQSTSAGAPAAPAGAVNRAARPSAVKPTSAAAQTDMTFYKAVEKKDADSQLTPNDATADASNSSPAPLTTPENKPAPSDPAVAPATSGYFVQVAAVSKQEDADSLVDALKKKQYSAFSANAPTDKLIHVQVGPFADLKEAEGIRAKLVSDGYNPILKK
jgi:DedD protein